MLQKQNSKVPGVTFRQNEIEQITIDAKKSVAKYLDLFSLNEDEHYPFFDQYYYSQLVSTNDEFYEYQ